MGKCLDDLRADYNRSLTENEIDEIFHEARQLWKGVKSSRKASNQNAYAAQLAAKMADEEKIAIALKKRNTYLQISRKIAIVENVLGNWRGHELEGLSSLMVGGKHVRQNARMSVDALSRGIKENYLGGLLTDIEGLKGPHLSIFKNGAMDREIAVALNTIDNPAAQKYAGPAEAMEIAEAVHKWQEKARIDQNRVGGFIGREFGYIVRQSHDPGKISAAGYQNWKKDIEGKIDWSRTGEGRFDPAQNPSFSMRERDNFLEAVYHNLSTGLHLAQGGADKNPFITRDRVGSLANRISHERVLHFKDGAAWYDYNTKYGKGTLRDAILGGLSHAADNVALMQIFGPSPQATLDSSILFIKRELNRRGDKRGVDRLQNNEDRLRNEMAEIDGSVNIPGHKMVAEVGRFVRGLQSMAKLGGALISAMSDAPVFAYEMAYQGKGFMPSLLRGLGLMVKGRGTLEQKRILSSCGVFYDSMCGDIIARFSGSDTPGKMSALMNLFFRINGLSWWTDSWKKAATLMMAHDMTLIRHLEFDKLSTQQKRLFELYGIDAGQWDMLRKGQTTLADGREYLTPEAAFDVTDAEIEAYISSAGMKVTSMRVENFRDELANRLRALYRDRVQYAVLEPDARTNAILRQGTHPGTAKGELFRYVTQFKSFPTVFMQRTMNREIYGRGFDGGKGFWSTTGGALKEVGKGAVASALLRNRHGEFSNFAGLLVMMTIFGYASMTAKQLLAGKNPRPVDDPKTWLAAAVQGGGAGIYGDFLFGERSRMGGSFASTFGGPTHSTLEDLTALYYAARDGKDVKANAFRVFYNNIPGNNLFYIRAAMDYMFLNNFLEYLNPGYLRRMERRVEKENGQTFWHRPAM